MSKETPSDIARARVSKWILESVPTQKRPVWTETRLAIDIGGYTHLVTNGQVFQCGHCGHWDPEWSATEVLTYFEAQGYKSYEVTVEVTVATEVIE